MMKYYLILFLFCFNNLHSQIPDSASIQFEKFLLLKFDSLKTLESDSIKLDAMKRIENEFATFLRKSTAYNYAFDSLKFVGKVKSPDNEFRMFNWNLAMGEVFQNFCIIQFNPKKENECRLIVLKDNSDIDKVGDAALVPSAWYGALYYKIIPVKFGSQTYYTLLGFDSFSPYVSKKVIDVLHFKDGIPFLGAPVFQSKGKSYSRVVFSFSARITMMLNYDESLKTIVFDHLSPSETRYAGQFEYYGPDFSFDGFVLSNERWTYAEDIKPNRPNPKDNRKTKKNSNNLRGIK